MYTCISLKILPHKKTAAAPEDIAPPAQAPALAPAPAPGADTEGNEYCEVCGQGGELVVCDMCPCAYHGLECLGSKVEDLPDPYSCPKCTGDLEALKIAHQKRQVEHQQQPMQEVRVEWRVACCFDT